MSTTRSFTQPELDQAQSPLGGLPAEITVKILRNLLRADDGCIRALHESKGYKTGDDAEALTTTYKKELPGTA